METEAAPWLFALVTAAWFWWMADRANRTHTLWAVGGGAFGLVASTLILGLGRARRIGFSDHHRFISELKWDVLAVVVVLIGGWILTAGLHRHHLALWRRFNPGTATAEPRISTAESRATTAKPAAPPTKPGIGKTQSSNQR